MTTRCLFLRRLLVVVVLLAMRLQAPAHQDPLGDVHPAVAVEGGNFAVYFYNNASRLNGQPRRYRMVFSPAGELLAPRHYAPEGEPAARSQKSHRGGAFGFAGEVVDFEGTHFVFPHWARLHHGRPFYLAGREGEKPIQRQLPWAGKALDDIVDVKVDAAHLTMLVTLAEDKGLYLYQFDRVTFEAPKTVRPGEPAHIYTFPGCSELVPYGDTFLVAWAEASKPRVQMVLDRWNPASGEVKHEIVSHDADWNTDISMAVTGDRLMIAYHCGPRDRPDAVGKVAPGGSRILTVFRKLE